MQAIHDRRGRTFVWPRNNVNVGQGAHAESEGWMDGGRGGDLEKQAPDPEPTLLQTWGHPNICLQHVHREFNQSQTEINIRPNSAVIGWGGAGYGVCQRTHTRFAFIYSKRSFFPPSPFVLISGPPFEMNERRRLYVFFQTGLWQSGRNHKPAACLMSSQSICRRRIDLLSEFLKNKWFCQGNNKELRENITARAV